MDIAALSTSLSMAKLQQSVEVSVLKKAMDSQGQAALQLLDTLPPATSFGHLLDTHA